MNLFAWLGARAASCLSPSRLIPRAMGPDGFILREPVVASSAQPNAARAKKHRKNRRGELRERRTGGAFGTPGAELACTMSSTAGARKRSIGGGAKRRMQIPLILDPTTGQSLTSQLVGQLRDAIRRGRIARGTKLPSSRRLSEQLGVSRNTVVRAYEELSSEGYVEARPASCVAVAACLPDSMMAPPDAAPGLHHDEGRDGVDMPMPALQPRCQDLVNRSRNRLSFDFFPGRPNAGLFPIKTWRRLLQNCLSHGGAVGLSQYGDPAGSIALRTAIAGHLAVTRGVVAEASRIIIVSGIQEGINIAARLFLGPGTAAVVENPGYKGAVFGFAAAGAEIISVPVDDHGLAVAGLPSRHAALAHVTPSHQYPTGRILAAPRRERLIAWARRNGCYLVEDDYDCDFRYEGSPLQAIAAVAPDCTIYLGTFSNSLGAGLRSVTWWYRARSQKPRAPQRFSSTTAIPGSNRSYLPR